MKKKRNIKNNGVKIIYIYDVTMTIIKKNKMQKRKKNTDRLDDSFSNFSVFIIFFNESHRADRQAVVTFHKIRIFFPVHCHVTDQHSETVDLREIHVPRRREHVAEHCRPKGVNVEDDRMEIIIGLDHKLSLPVEGF